MRLSKGKGQKRSWTSLYVGSVAIFLFGPAKLWGGAGYVYGTICIYLYVFQHIQHRFISFVSYQMSVLGHWSALGATALWRISHQCWGRSGPGSTQLATRKTTKRRSIASQRRGSTTRRWWGQRGWCRQSPEKTQQKDSRSPRQVAVAELEGRTQIVASSFLQIFQKFQKNPSLIFTDLAGSSLLLSYWWFSTRHMAVSSTVTKISVTWKQVWQCKSTL